MPEFRPDPKPEKTTKKPKKPLKKQKVKYKPKSHDMIKVFEVIAETRDWKCFVTGEKLFNLKDTSFMHILPKALNKYPTYRAFEPNIVLASDEIHRMWDFAPRSELKKDPRFTALFALEEELKQRYPKLD